MITEERLKQEIQDVKDIIEDYENLLKTEINEDEKEWMFDDIKKYRNYLKAYEFILNGFKYEAGSY